MKPIEFEGQTHILAENSPEYTPLPVQGGIMEFDRFNATALLSCWELSDSDVETILKTRKLWLTVLTFAHPLQPQMLSVDRPEFSACWNPRSSSPPLAKSGAE